MSDHQTTRVPAKEAHARALAEAMTEIVCIMDARGRCLEENTNFEKHTGLSRMDDEGRDWLQALHPDDRERAAATWAHAGQSCDPYSVEYRLRMRDGSYRWFVSRGRLMAAGDGSICWVDVATDIHDRKLTELALEDTRRRYQELVNESHDGIYQRGKDRRFLFVNPSFCRMLGYERDELLGMSLDDIRDREDAHVAPILEKADNGDEIPALLIWRFKHRDGHWVPVETSAKRLDDGRLQVTVRDISERERAVTALRASEERFRTLVQATSQVVWVTDAQGNTLDASDGFEEVTGLDRASARGEGWLDVLHPDDRDQTMAAWRYATENRVPYSVENRSRMSDGSYHWFAVHGQPIFEPDGAIREWIGTCTDINDRKLADQVLRDSQHQYLELVEGSRDGIYQRDENGRFLFVNMPLCRMLGYERDELLRMSIHDIANLDEKRIASGNQPMDEGAGPPALLAIRLKHRDGSWIPVETTAKRLNGGRMQVMVRDISARVDAERRLEEERNFIMQSMNSLPGIFYVFDSQGRFMRWNKRLEEISGYSPEEIRDMQPASLTPEEDRTEAANLIDTAFTLGEVEAEKDLLTRDGRRIPYYFNGRRFQWQGKACIVGMGIDISDRRRAEQRVHEYIGQTRELSRSLLMTQELERRGIARELHDEVGSALTALQMSLKRIEDGMPAGAKNLPQESRAIVATLLSQVRTMSLDLRPSVLDDLGLAAAARWYVRERLETAGLDVRLDVPPDLGRFPAEIENTCFRVLQGAATNALRHGQARTLEIHLLRSKDKLELIVQDDGCGFDVEAARARANSGASLGILAMEERIRLVNGEFSIESAAGRGTTVHVTVPLDESDGVAPGMMEPHRSAA